MSKILHGILLSLAELAKNFRKLLVLSNIIGNYPSKVAPFKNLFTPRQYLQILRTSGGGSYHSPSHVI